MTAQTRPRVVIVGAGFGGLWAARELAGALVDVTLIDRHNYHTFFPLLYQVAAAELEPEDIAHPVRTILRGKKNVRFLMAEVTGVDLEAKVVKTSLGDEPYDYLVLATGSRPHFFGVKGAEEHALRLRALEEGVCIRNHILTRFEHAAALPPEQRAAELHFAIVGGGPTGVEFAGALAELVYGPLKKDFPSLDFGEVSITVIEASDGLLTMLVPKLRAYALRRLKRMGVDVRLKAAVESITADGVHLKDGEFIAARTVVWTAGVGGHPDLKTWGLPVVRGGRVAVKPTLQLSEHAEVYVVGDSAYLEQDGVPLPMVAPTATQQGVAAARNIRRQIAGEQPKPFRYRDLGTLAVIGRNSAAAEVFGRSFSGIVAWFIWLVYHLYALIGFRNRLVVLTSWAWDYLFLERVVRLVLPGDSSDSRPSTGSGRTD
ncbi:MAG: NAD(P)/FAD-dependent oxidoreductase [Chloroflexi bacterium]|nr:NAD(P)/FAD-dependent oxidoreductase [Chloroflexota bacterium]